MIWMGDAVQAETVAPAMMAITAFLGGIGGMFLARFLVWMLWMRRKGWLLKQVLFR